MKTISIIIRTKNEERWIGHCLRSVFDQEFQDFEVIIVDNESTDKTVEKAKQFPVKIVNYTEEFRPGKALNLGIQASVGKYLVCLSGHCIPTNNQWLTYFVKNIELPEVAGVYGRQEPFSFTSDYDKRDLLFTFGLEKKIQTKDGFFDNANSIIKKDVWDKIHFDSQTLHIENLIWGREVIKQGYKIIYEPEASVYHHHGIHHSANPRRCEEVVEILEKLDAESLNRSTEIEKLKIVGFVPLKGQMRYLAGRPLLEYTLKSVSQSKYLKDIVVLTNDKEIEDFSKKMGVNFVFSRPPELLADHIELQDVLEYGLSKLEENQIIPDIVVYLSPTNPFRPEDLIDKAISHLVKGGYDSVIPVIPEYRSCWINEEGIKRIDKGFIPQQFKEPVYIGISGLVTAVYTDVLRNKKSRLGEKIGMIELDDIIHSIDIGKSQGNKIAELLIKNRHFPQ